MSRYLTRPVAKMARFLEPGERIVVAADFTGPMSEASSVGAAPVVGGFLASRGRRAADNLAYREGAAAGYLAVTDRRLLCAKDRLLVGPGRTFVAEPLESCSLTWADAEIAGGAVRELVIDMPSGEFVGIKLLLRSRGLFRRSDREAVEQIAAAIVEAFGPRATLWSEG